MKILFIPFTPSLAHMTRCLSIAETLKAKDNECMFAIGTEGKDFIEKAGFSTKTIPEIDTESFKNDRGWKWFTKKYFLDNLQAELVIIDEFNPDIIIFDFRFTTALSAKIKSKRSISILHASAVSLILETKRTAVEIISFNDSSSDNSIKSKILQLIFPKVFGYFVKKPLRKIKSILKSHNYTNVRTIFDLLLGDINFIADIPEFIPEPLKLPENFYIVGPLTWSGWDKDENFSFEGIDSKPIIYITMGSTIEAKPTLLKLIESLKDLPYNIIISKGKNELNLPEKLENVYQYTYVPGKLVASKSSLVIYHGGHETLMQVLSCSVPSLVIPVNPDQLLVAKQIKKLGIGDYLKHHHSFPMEEQPLSLFSNKDISDKVIEIINNKQCKQKCESMKDIMINYISSKDYLKYIN
jgi:UDP:flavonoid glycosyltransferase YjiC (YdhE family)